MSKKKPLRKPEELAETTLYWIKHYLDYRRIRNGEVQSGRADVCYDKVLLESWAIAHGFGTDLKQLIEGRMLVGLIIATGSVEASRVYYK